MGFFRPKRRTPKATPEPLITDDQPQLPLDSAGKPAPTRIDAMIAIREVIDTYQTDPITEIAGKLHRVREQVPTDDDEFGNPAYIDKPLIDGVKLRSEPIGEHGPTITARVNAFQQTIDRVDLECKSDNGLVTRQLAMNDPRNAGLITAVETKFANEGQDIRAELDEWVAEQRASMQPGTYFMGDLRQVAIDAGHDEDEVDLLLYQNDFAVPEDLACRLVDLGYVNFRDSQQEATPVADFDRPRQSQGDFTP